LWHVEIQQQAQLCAFADFLGSEERLEEQFDNGERLVW